jgi:hypothetical protein
MPINYYRKCRYYKSRRFNGIDCIRMCQWENCMGQSRGNEHQITVAPTDPTTYKVSCYYGDIEGCSYSKTIMVNPCQLHIIAEKQVSY